ncbi:hypothetical protein B1H10_01890 [candidate division KSB1 bacterium 4484_188]|nr:MAG: hypothetical protein B1H10_01890 [candidate division KSB1 bacterium 4484_188]
MGENKRTPLFIIAILIIFGSIGFFINHDLIANIQDDSRIQIKKFLTVVQDLKNYYVEDINWEEAFAGAISGMLSKLDPHSIYIEPKTVERNKENFSGHYEGIGIQFDVIDGYITVISPIAGSPSERLGLMPGDKIVKINGKSAYGIDRDEVPKKLKGPKGTSVDVTVVRDGLDEPIELTIIRDVIPIYTVTSKFMADDSTGYVWVNRFAQTTSQETREAIEYLRAQGLRRLILDLRQNPGGYLHEAVRIAGMFLPGHRLVVETRGKNNRVFEQYYSDQWRRGAVYNFPLIILIDRGSASASEIVSGAIQDYDRGLIVGTNSFGKGLVQREFGLFDGSAVRITISKYYTPSGRLIQRKYKHKKLSEYYAESMDTTINSEDSLKHRPQFHTHGGRIVYGGGGIRPDIVVPYKSYTKSPKLRNKIAVKRLFFEFGNEYAHNHRQLKTNLKRFQEKFHITKKILADFKNYCVKKKIKFKDEEFERDSTYISTQIKSEIARSFWDNNGFYYILLHNDNQFLKALSLFNRAKEIALIGKK